MRDHFEREEIVHIWSFFVGEIEIYDFVVERAKKCIASKRENCIGFWFYILYTQRCYFGFYRKLLPYMAGGHTVPSRYVAIAIFYKITRKK